MEGKVSGLGAVHPLLILNLFRTWFLPPFKRNTLSSAKDGLKKREKREIYTNIIIIRKSNIYNVMETKGEMSLYDYNGDLLIQNTLCLAL